MVCLQMLGLQLLLRSFSSSNLSVIPAPSRQTWSVASAMPTDTPSEILHLEPPRTWLAQRRPRLMLAYCSWCILTQGCTGHSMQPCLTLHLARRPKGENPLERPPWGGAAQVDRERRPPSYGGRRGLAAWAACGGLPPGAKLQYGQHQREATSAPGSAGRARAFGRANMHAGAARINSRHAHVR